MLHPKRHPLRAPAAMPLAILALTAAGLGLVALSQGYTHFVIALVALTVVAGTGLNVLLGLAGLISFGHAGFYALGAYASAILTLSGLSFWLALPAAGLLTALVGALLAVPAMRVKGPYLAMMTIAFGFLVEHGLVEGGALTGGQNGLVITAGPVLFGEALAERGLAILSVLGAGLSLYGFHRLRLARLGRAMRAVRDSEAAAASLGFDPVRVKTAAFAISAGLTGLAGAVLPPLMLFIAPSSFPFSQSILFVLSVVVGGAGTVLGPLCGALVTVLLPELLAGLAEYRLIFFGLTTLVVLWLVPAGIVGTLARLLPRAADARAPTAGDGSALPRREDGEPLVIEGLGISFGGIRAADGVSLTAAAGRVTSLIGPNGAGKTTVLNMVSGFYRPDAGAIRLGRRDLAGAPAHAIARAGIARTYQTTRLFGSLSVLDNVALAVAPGSLLRRSTAGDAGHAAALLAFAGYAGPLDRPAAELPHVDRRLVEIARALAGGPKVLLLDEPAAGLTRADTDRIGSLLRRISESGVAVILVEHDMPLVMGTSDHILVMDAGRPIATGAPAEVRRDPAVLRAYLGGAETPARPRAAPWQGPADPVLASHRLRAGYGAAPVLDDLALSVRPGETVALLGANGAGKSTAMRALSGLLRPVQGSIVLADRPVAELPAHAIARLGLALVPEGRQVFPELTVIENIRLGARGRGGRIDPAEVEALLDRFPRLRERAGSRAGLLSGGEQQMLAIARGLMARPRILLLDEPSLGLAPAMINTLYGVVADLRDRGITILIVDQMAALALTVADRGYVLEQGRVVAEGSAAELQADKGLEAAYLGAA
ncbi:ABC-type branched-subunit amino acid transport system ATPase component/ABC-type branched-subunit amino acid transport system permease subunit [Methylobacterium sp. BE186]|uniref:branched-chain amino acid ABC transporter ATP-binding protein/permease n=1 Tax=Methylobacterium sp. BE186 TaxID=2817715 RepID=UPI0028572F1C|nr:branched-chain amino acid ABC transporter ATP-binding protein/permease [Methylobacterium sp. BE186]MDR7039693.1 ABC-type branched-subunit amino acid transport system ATPase component/ABC-type branched-subunit amino acid transport system permease subunit [Methylobacterium sp. BE186]